MRVDDIREALSRFKVPTLIEAEQAIGKTVSLFHIHSDEAVVTFTDDTAVFYRPLEDDPYHSDHESLHIMHPCEIEEWSRDDWRKYIYCLAFIGHTEAQKALDFIECTEQLRRDVARGESERAMYERLKAKFEGESK